VRALLIPAFGPPEVLRVVDVDPPEPGPGEVRVRVRAAGVQPADCAVRRGRMPPGATPALPIVPGNECAGVVDRLGAGVEGLAVGDEVIGFRTLGCDAEHAVLPADQVVPRDGMPWEEAGALSASGQTAHTALEDLGVTEGETILVHAAAGGVGSAAVQIARALGATVVGTAREANHDYLRSLGAIPVAYGDGVVERVRTLAPRGVDAALDAIGGDAPAASLALVADPDRVGTLVDVGAAERLGVRALRSRRSADRLRALVDLWRRGALRVQVSRALPLERAAEAHREVEAGHVRGKIVLTPG
jgi:NADPH:quinone reductase-like Zn-dependent oxidoreductase